MPLFSGSGKLERGAVPYRQGGGTGVGGGEKLQRSRVRTGAGEQLVLWQDELASTGHPTGLLWIGPYLPTQLLR
jgi:hypothetical protein